jgi:hypothetical protein
MNALIKQNGTLISCFGAPHSVIAVRKFGVGLSKCLKSGVARMKLHRGELAVEAPAGLSDAQRVEVKRVIRKEYLTRVVIVNGPDVILVEEFRRVTVRQVKL